MAYIDPATGGTPYGHSTYGTAIKAPPIAPLKGSIAHGIRRPKPVVQKTIKVKAHTRTPKPPKPPLNPDQGLIDAAVRLRYGPQDQALKQGLAQNARFSAGIGDWYKNAVDEIRGLQAQGQANSQSTLGAITSYTSQPTLPNATDNQAATARNNLNAEFAAQFGRDATANSDAMDKLAAAYAIQQANTLSQANVQHQQLLGQQGTLGQQKADYALQYGSGLTSAEQKAINDQSKIDIAAKALGIKSDTLNKVQIPLAKSLSQNRTAGQRVARSNARSKRLSVANQAMQNDRTYKLNVQKFGAAQAKDTYQRTHGLGPYKPAGKSSSQNRYTKTQLNHYDNQWNGAIALAGHLKAAKSYIDKQTKKEVPVTRNVVYSALLKKYPNDPEFAAAAADMVYGKSLSQHDLHVLATKGVHPRMPLVNTVIGGTNKVVKALGGLK